MFNNFRGTIVDNVVSDVTGNNMFLVLSDVCIMHVSCGSMSKSCAAAQATPVLTGSSTTAVGSVDSSNTVDGNKISDTLELVKLIHLIKIIDIVDDNVNDYNVVNRHDLWGTIAVRSNSKVIARTNLSMSRIILWHLVISFSSSLITRQIIARHLHTLISFVIFVFLDTLVLSAQLDRIR